MPKQIAICLSLANLCYLRIWSELLTYQPYDSYWMKHAPRPVDFAALMFNVLALAAVLLALALWVAPRFPRLARWGLLLFLLVPLNALRSVLANRFDYLRSPLLELLHQKQVVIPLLAVAAFAIFAFLRWPKALAGGAQAVLAVTFPFTLLTFGQGLWAMSHYDPRPFADKPCAPMLPSKAGPRVLWVIFDEFDYRLGFPERNATVRMPEFDRFRREALFASHAYPPGPETPVSMPAYFTGQFLDSAGPRRPDLLLLAYDDRHEENFAAANTVFVEARKMGLNTALEGWYHPYCRVLNESLTNCGWWEMARQHNSMGDSFASIVVNQPRSLFETNLFSPFGLSLSALQQVRVYNEILARAKAVASDRRYGLAVVHINVPHAPHAWDRTSHSFSKRNSPITGYLDSLELADRALGELRSAMEAAGTWEATHVVLSSDHPFREAELLDGKTDPRVPFLLKTSGAAQGAEYDEPFNTVLTRELLLAALRGEVADTSAAVNWLDRHRADQRTRWRPD